MAYWIRRHSRPQQQRSKFIFLISTIYNPLSYFYQFYPICAGAKTKCSSTHTFSHKSTWIQNSFLKNEKRLFCLQSAKNQEVSSPCPKAAGLSRARPSCTRTSTRLVFSSHVPDSSADPKISSSSPRKHVPTQRGGNIRHRA